LFGRAARPILIAGVSTLVFVCVRPPTAWGAPAPSPSPLTSPSISWGQFQQGPDHGGELAASVEAPLRPSWTAAAPGTTHQGASGAVIDGDVAVAVATDRVFAANLSTGKIEWQFDRARGSITTPAVGRSGHRDVLVYTEGATTSTSAVVAVDLADQSQVWRQSLKGVSGSGVTISGNEVYLGDRSGNLYGFSLSNGSPASWSPMGLAGGSIDAPPAASSTAVVVTERNHDNGSVKIDAVDPTTGDGLWSYSAGVSAGTATTATLDDRNAIFGVGGQQQVRAVPLASKGTVSFAWSTHTRSTFSPLSSPAEAGGKVFIVSTTASDSALYALNATDGTKLWDFQFQQPAIETSPVVVGTTIYVGTDDGLVVGIDIPSGLLVWQAGTGPGAIGPLAVANDELVVSKRGSRGGLLAFRTDPTGTRLHIESPTKLHLGTVLVRYAIAFVLVFGVVFGGLLLLTRIRPGLGEPPDEDQSLASTPAEPEES
jgi:outer membrane protein assembly factor BamB